MYTHYSENKSLPLKTILNFKHKYVMKKRKQFPVRQFNGIRVALMRNT